MYQFEISSPPIKRRDTRKNLGLIILHPLGETKQRNFKREMARAGHISIRGREFPKMQLMTVEELLEGQRFDTPPVLGRQQKAQQQLIF